MAYTVQVKIRPTNLTDLTVTADLHTYTLDDFSEVDGWLEGGIRYVSNTEEITFSSTGYETQTIIASALVENNEVTLVAEMQDVEILSDGTNNYQISDKVARAELLNKADISDIPTKTSDLTNDSNFATVSQIPTNNNQLTNGAGYITSTDLPTNYVTTDTEQTIISDKVFTGYIKGQAINNTNHAFKLGTNGVDFMNFYEYGGLWNFYQSRAGTNTLLAKIGALTTSTNDETLTTAKWVNSKGYITGITSSDVTTALGYTPQTSITGGATTITSSNLTANRALISNSSGKVAVSAVTSTELGYLDGVTSAIQTQIDSKQATVTGAATTITGSNLTTNRALISNGSGKVAVSAVTSTELGYLDGVTSAIQTQLNDRITTTTKTVADSGCTFALSNGLKIITTEVSFTAGEEYSWSYGTTFTNVPNIFITRRSGATTTTGIYDAWVRGSVGKSSCSIYCATNGTFMLMAIGN